MSGDSPIVTGTTDVLELEIDLIGGTVASQAVTDQTTVDPFSGVTIADVDNPAQTLTVDVQLDTAAKGTLTNLGGFVDQGGGLYRFSGTAAAATTAIQNDVVDVDFEEVDDDDQKKSA